MQDLVYKIVPNLEKDEYERERSFYAERGLPCPKDQQQEEGKKEDCPGEEEEATGDEASRDYHRFDEQVSLLLECVAPQLRPLKKKYIRVSSLATVTHLKKFIATKLLQSVDKYKDLDITCDDEPLYKDHTLKFVYVTRWRTKEPPMRLQFVPKQEQPIDI
eukprot:TRINITY_DN2260_c0_g1_i1.p1 TRINITY_DN2260_c0_g1~~TRINITY_DN2260_c0_g1_i1.p1  ORF type:complete len:161 (-),score=69.87 TRINITY_DN2260_c0_g1_i1:245-727(-)